jgi:hypothetical protein
MAVDDTLSIAEELHALASPLRERLRLLEQEIERAEETLAALRVDRDQLKKALRAVDPKYGAPRPGPKPTKAAAQVAGVTPGYPAEEVIERAVTLLKGSKLGANGGFAAKDLAMLKDMNVSLSYAGVVTTALHRRGLTRLDHVGKSGAKFYVLI